MTLMLYNTLSGKKEAFEPLVPGKVKMYVCGVTVYDLSHIGHARAYVAFDVVQRYLRFSGFDVTYVRNFTDVDDKIINRANERGEPPQALADRFIDEYHKDMEALDVRRADIEPKVSTHIREIVDIVQRLIDRGRAYAVDGDVYFDVAAFPEYGALSKRPLEELQAGARVEVDSRKKTPADFALWKAAKPGEPFWESPWGPGRPGWHIECSAMSCTHLGEQFDIHGGGMDLIFPHHENEIAQSQGATDKRPVRYWMHNGFVNIDSEKMSKSLGNFFTIRDVLGRYHPQAIRLFLLSTHYRNFINYSMQALDEASKRAVYLYDALATVDAALAEDIDFTGPLIEEGLVDAILPKFREAMDDDFNTCASLGHLSEAVKLANDVVRRKKKTPGRGRTLRRIRQELTTVGEVLGIMSKDPAKTLAELRHMDIVRLGIDEAAVDRLVADRVAARVGKDFDRADALRAELTALGIEVMDTAAGTVWRPLLGQVDFSNCL